MRASPGLFPGKSRKLLKKKPPSLSVKTGGGFVNTIVLGGRKSGRIMRKFRREIGFFCMLPVCVLMTAMLIFSKPGYASSKGTEESKEVIVGYSDNDEMIQTDSNGNLYGYGITYLNELCRYTGWECVYVELPPEERLEGLLDGRVDLLCNVHRDCAEQEELLFSEESSGPEYGMLCTWKDNNEIFYNDYEAIDGKKIGIDRNSDLEQSLRAYGETNGITYEPVYLDGLTEQMAALKNETVDMVLLSSLQETYRCKYVGKAGLEKEYFAVRKGKESLMEELNQAGAALRQEKPFYISSIYKNFYGNPEEKLTGITREEYEFINQNEAIRVACDADSYPLEYVDEETGEYTGVYAAAMRLISEESGLNFEFIPLTNFSEAWDLVASGEVDLIAGNYGNERSAEYYHMTYSQSYLSAEYTLIGRKGLEIRDGMSIALPKNYVGLRYFFQMEEPGWKIALYDSVRDCLKAVNREEADVTAVNAIFLQTVYNLNQYDNLKIVPNMTKTFPISVGIGNNHTEELKSIIDKAIYQIPESEFEKCITEHAINVVYEPSLMETAGKFFPHICGAVLLIILAVFVIIRKREKHFRHLAMTDSITGMWNRVKFYKEAQEILEKNKDRTYLMITLDINKFKFINNDFGSKAGDCILCVMGERIQEIFKERGYTARNTADIFLILTEEKDYRPEMLEPLSKPIYFNNNGKRQYYKVVIKAGIRRIMPGESASDLIPYVDQASIARKTIKDVAGCSQAYYDENMKNILEKESAIEKRMEEALENREFQVYLQPKYDLRSERIMGAEALIRWADPEKGMIPPDEFIPLFEKNGFILKLDFFVYEEVLKRMAQWKQEGKPSICVSVNVSRVHISTMDFFSNLNRLVEKYQVSRRDFELELTETIIGGELNLVKAFIQECKREGFKVSIDDFGSGYSSLNLLKELPVDVLKIDKGFLDEAEESMRSNIIVEQVVEMAKRMEIGTLCEGVETERQLSFLKKIGCDMAQGYLFSRPVPVTEFEQMI